MTTDTLFDLVAPIAIMHFADLLYEEKAMRAIDRLLENQTDADVVSEFGDGSDRPWADYLESSKPPGLPEIKDVYESLFRAVIEDAAPDWQEFFDRWGAYAWKDGDGQLVFSGDAAFQMPWYETAALLRERIENHETETTNER